MIVFLNTEFTGLTEPELLNIGAFTVDGCERCVEHIAVKAQDAPGRCMAGEPGR